MATERQKAIGRALTLLIPRVPFGEAEAIRAAAGERRLRRLPPSTALWLAAVARIRHAHTDYDALLDEGYDRDAARFFVVDHINAVLDGWGATRRLDPEAGDEKAPGGDDAGEGEDEPD